MLSPQNFVKYMLELRSLSIWIQKFRDKPPPPQVWHGLRNYQLLEFIEWILQ
jgi:hypothetical protein